MDVYSRDVLAFPLLELARLLEKVRLGEFMPDSSRSGRWRRKTTLPSGALPKTCRACEEVLTDDSAFHCDCGNIVLTLASASLYAPDASTKCASSAARRGPTHANYRTVTLTVTQRRLRMTQTVRK